MRGDVGDALERLRRVLARCRYRGHVQPAHACSGAPEQLLPLLHFLLLQFSSEVSRLLAERGYELSGRTDMRFVENAFRACNDVLEYRPVLTPKQFLSVSGFAERKMDLLADIGGKVLDLHKQLAPKKAVHRGASKAKVVRQLGDAGHTQQREQQHQHQRGAAPRVVVPGHPVSAYQSTVDDSCSDRDAPQPRRPPVEPSAPPPVVVAPAQDSRCQEEIASLSAKLEAQSLALNAITEHLSEFEKSVQSMLASLDAKVVILDGRIRFVEHQFAAESQKVANAPASESQDEEERRVQEDKRSTENEELAPIPSLTPSLVSAQRDFVHRSLSPIPVSISADHSTPLEFPYSSSVDDADVIQALEELPESQTCVRNVLDRFRQTQDLLSRSLTLPTSNKPL